VETEAPRPTQWEQDPLFLGGYQALTLELTMHLTGAQDEIQCNVVVRDTATNEWISAVVPQMWLNTRWPLLGGEQLMSLLSDVQRMLTPF